MADALLGVVVEKSISLVQNEFATLSGLKEKAERLSNTLTLIRAVLEDAEERQLTDRAVKIWLQQLRDAAHVLDDILDDCSLQSLQHGGLSTFNLKNILFRREVGRKLNEMIERLDQIADVKNKFGLREGVRERPSEVAEWRQTSSKIASPQVYGRDEDKEKVVQFLLSTAHGSDSLSVYPIVGLGGLGKTTLAQLVYNDQRVSNHFNLKMWICVSENFSLNSILRSIIESIMEVKYDVMNLDVMERKVQELLQSKRYLLVLDDVWKRSQELEFGLSQDKWFKLRSVLSCGSKGSSIVVSTRDEDVAAIMGTCQAHRLSGLSEDDCWLLFKQRAFGPGKEERAELVAIGKEIVKKCRGLPLAAQALGGLMRPKSNEKEWLQVKESKLWTLSDDSGILPALRLSYSHLTPTLKQCFAFCAIFPKDKEIMKQDLIHLWMANGFISSDENLDVEEVGSMIWNELYQKSFFQDVRIDVLGDIHFKMHDLVHDLAQSITKQECMYLEKIEPKDLQGNTHHLGYGYVGETPFNKEACKKVESLRTLYQFQVGLDGPEVSIWFRTSLRVLRTSNSKLSLVGSLTHLRYLELRDLEIETLPDSISDLRKLEVLKLFDVRGLGCLPKRLSRLQSLRHLLIIRCTSLRRMFPNIRKLSHLRTLSVYMVEKEAGYSLAELSHLNLGGRLQIEGLTNVVSSSEAEAANLKCKQDLLKLTLSWYDEHGTKSHATDAGKVLEALQPHPNLKKLEIYWYEGLHLPGWMGNKLVLNNLVYLKLDQCKMCGQLPPLGKLPSLEELEISGMDNVQYVDDDEGYDGVEARAFPSLKMLTISKLPKLERLIKMETGDMFPCLSLLSVDDCCELQLSFLPSIKTLTVYGEVNIEFLKSISSLKNLDSLCLLNFLDLTAFPEGVMNNLTSLKTLEIRNFRKLKEVPYEITKLNALESLEIASCPELESFPEQALEGLRSLRTLNISWCEGLRSLPNGLRHLSALEELTIEDCEELAKRCKEGTGEDWHKIAHIPKVSLILRSGFRNVRSALLLQKTALLFCRAAQRPNPIVR